MPRKSLRRRRRSSKKSKKTTKKKSTRRSENSKIRGGGGVFSSVTRRRNYTPRNPQPINRRVRDLSTRRMNPQSNPQRRARDLRSQDLIRLPEDIILGQIVEMHPLLTPKLTNATIERAVKDYIAGGTRKERVLTKYGEIGNWDVSRVTNMGGMFQGAKSFNQPLNKWNVSNVTNMEAMFNGARSFNQPLNDWNVSKVTDMGGMFMYASSFNQPLNNWNVSNVRDIRKMFADARSFR